MIERTYYVVPGHYTQDFEGREDADLETAVLRAMRHKKDIGIAVSRVFVDKRAVESQDNGTRDYVCRRWEVFADGSHVLRHVSA